MFCGTDNCNGSYEQVCSLFSDHTHHAHHAPPAHHAQPPAQPAPPAHHAQPPAQQLPQLHHRHFCGLSSFFSSGSSWLVGNCSFDNHFGCTFHHTHQRADNHHRLVVSVLTDSIEVTFFIASHPGNTTALTPLNVRGVSSLSQREPRGIDQSGFLSLIAKLTVLQPILLIPKDEFNALKSIVSGTRSQSLSGSRLFGILSSSRSSSAQRVG